MAISHIQRSPLVRGVRSAAFTAAPIRAADMLVLARRAGLPHKGGESAGPECRAPGNGTET